MTLFLDGPDGYDVIIRTCVVDGGGVNADTEIGRLDHCGFINQLNYNGQVLNGCLLRCNTHACNSAQRKHISISGQILALLAFVYLSRIHQWIIGTYEDKLFCILHS